VELYFVRSLDGGDLLGACRAKGIAVASDGDGVTVAHETLHTCGLDDIYTVVSASGENPVPGQVSPDYLPSDWGGGYYALGMTQRELVARLIMRSGGINGIDTASPRDLPVGTVFGWRHSIPGDSSSPMVLDQAGVGQSSIQNTPRSF